VAPASPPVTAPQVSTPVVAPPAAPQISNTTAGAVTSTGPS
jgi:hypothetical protein